MSRGMTKLFRYAAVLALAGAVIACGYEDPEYGKSGSVGFGQAKLALKSSAGQNVLRIGQSLTLASVGLSDHLKPNTRYGFELDNDQTILFRGDILTDMQGRVPSSTLHSDTGEFEDDVKAGDTLVVKIDDGVTEFTGKIEVKARMLAGTGWAIDEVTSPHIYSADAQGKAANSFVIGGKVKNEVAGPIYVAGDHFPPKTTVDVYVVKDRDVWKGQRLPTKGSKGYLAGPISVTTDANGKLPLTSTKWAPKGASQLGTYDLVADVDRNGVFDWSLTAKDAADGEDKVGFTVQYSRAWLKTYAGKHLVVNLAYSSSNRGKGTWRNKYSSGQVYGYVNPPVSNAQKHRKQSRGVWVLIEHQSWKDFWTNPDPKLDADPKVPGSRDLKPYLVNYGGKSGGFSVPLQPHCTNAPPRALLNAEATAKNRKGKVVKNFDVVFLATGNKYDKTAFQNPKETIYYPGVSLLDLNVSDTSAKMVNPKTIKDGTAKGFSVTN